MENWYKIKPSKVHTNIPKRSLGQIKFEIFGYHTEKDKNGEIKLYTFENEMVKEVLRAIMRKGRMIQDDTFAILPRWAKDNRKITREESIEHMVKETYFS